MVEYKQFAEELDKSGNQETARHMKEMADLSAKSNECLGRTLATLNIAWRKFPVVMAAGKFNFPSRVRL